MPLCGLKRTSLWAGSLVFDLISQNLISSLVKQEWYSPKRAVGRMEENSVCSGQIIIIRLTFFSWWICLRIRKFSGPILEGRKFRIDIPKNTKKIESTRFAGIGYSDAGLQSCTNLKFLTFPFGGMIKSLGLASLSNKLESERKIIKFVLTHPLVSCVTLAQSLTIPKR